MLLLILRHGKAEKDSPTGRDVDRPLAARGRKQAAYLAGVLAKPHPPLARPVAVLSSRAERARSTATLVADALNLALEFDDALAPGTDVKHATALVRRLAMHHKPVLIVGHNPQFEDLVAALTGDENDLHTGELVAIELTDEPGKLAGRELARLRLDQDD